MKEFYYSYQARTHFDFFRLYQVLYYWLRDCQSLIETLRDNSLYYLNMFQAVFFFIVMEYPHIGYQKCIAILRVTLLRNHMSIALILVNYNLTNFRDICQRSHCKSPPWVVCSLVWEGMGDLSALN